MKNDNKRFGSLSGKAVLAGLIISGAATVKTDAAEFAYGFGYSAEHTSNISRVATNERGDLIHTLLAGAAYQDNGPELAAHIMGQAEMRYYQQDTLDDDTRYLIDASAVWTISPQQLTWTVEERRTQAVEDIRLADTPNNLTNVNVFRTGPDVYFRFGGGNTLQVGARAGKETFSGVGTGDNDRVSGLGRWLYAVNPSTTASLNYEAEKVDYDNDVANIDYTRTERFIRLESRRDPTQWTIDYGQTEVDRDRGLDLEGPLERVTVTHRISTTSSIGLIAARQFEDAGTVVLSTLTNPASPTPTPAVSTAVPVASADVFEARRAEAFFLTNGSDWSTQWRIFGRDYDYQLTDQDRRERGGRLEISHNPGGIVTTTLFGETMNTKFTDIVREDDDRTLGLRLRYRISRTLSAAVEGSRIARSSTDPTREYVDRRFLLGIYYSSGPLYSPAGR